ncbi:hypothetical protein AB0A74_19320 [Saccharothrix sp. NPDC042600]|uniref:hypothetical protein n=1 Tax=Saccharothrix TaxID=2071 RepID=UPI00340ACB96|nr:hypothetical protein GCM10017745_76320 [Saccharothrix mutabilis subsp. capreolus]
MGDNEVGGRVHGPVVQAGAIHGDVHVHHHPARPLLVGMALVALAFVAALLWWPRPEPAHSPGPASTSASATPTSTAAEPTRTGTPAPRTATSSRPGGPPAPPADTSPPALPTLG